MLIANCLLKSYLRSTIMKESKLVYFLIGAAAILLYISNRLWPTSGAQLLDIIYTLVLLGGVIMLILSGTLRRSKYRMPVLLGAAAVITGLVFSFKQLKGADVIVIAGGATMLIFYSIHYITKRSRALMDHLKMTWLSFALTAMAFVIFGLPYAIYITDAVNILLLIMLVMVISSQPGSAFTPRKEQGRQ